MFIIAIKNQLMKVKRLPTNWYNNEISLTFELLSTFVENIEQQITIEVKKYKVEKETHCFEYDEYPNISSSFDIHKGLNSTTWHLDTLFNEYFPTLQRSSALISLIGTFEHELNSLCNIFRNVKNLSFELKDITGKGFERSIRFLEIAALPPIKKDNLFWQEIVSIQKIRSLFVHNNGLLFNIDGKLRVDENAIVSKNTYLTGDNSIIIKAGYLKYVLDSFNDFFKYIDGLIQDYYNNNA